MPDIVPKGIIGNQDAMLDSLRKIIFHHRFGQVFGVLFFSFWIWQRWVFNTVHNWLWWLVTLQFILFVAAYLVRSKAQSRAAGIWQTVFPFICAGMPFALDSYPFKPYNGPAVPVWAYLALMAAGTLIISAGVMNLRGSFSIMAEVRKPVFGGIYQISRHPMYLGSMVSALGVLLYNFSYFNLLIFLAFCVLQIIRAGVEERKITKSIPEYAAYAGKVGWFWKLGRKKPMAPGSDLR